MSAQSLLRGRLTGEASKTWTAIEASPLEETSRMTNLTEPGGEGTSSHMERDDESAGLQTLVTIRGQLRPALLSVPLLTLLTGVVFPLALAALAWPLFPRQAGGSLLEIDQVAGSELIGQEFTGPGYFHSRPSAAGRGYDATASGGTNLGPANPKLLDGARDDPATPGVDESFLGIRGLASEYRARNGLDPDVAVPVDAVTRSGSGLDPHISPENAAAQVPRVAFARGLSEVAVRRLVAEHTGGRQLGILGAPRVTVLLLNQALDRAAPTIPPTPAR
jgi:potassium-transporting ATPase KdpC subunit